MNAITCEKAEQVFKELKSIAKIKDGGLRLNSIDGGHLTFVAANDDEAFLLGTELYGIIKRYYGIKELFSAWWDIEKIEANGFDDEYELTIGTNL